MQYVSLCVCHVPLHIINIYRFDLKKHVYTSACSLVISYVYITTFIVLQLLYFRTLDSLFHLAADSVTSSILRKAANFGWLWANDQLVDSQNACGKNGSGPQMFSAAALFCGKGSGWRNVVGGKDSRSFAHVRTSFSCKMFLDIILIGFPLFFPSCYIWTCTWIVRAMMQWHQVILISLDAWVVCCCLVVSSSFRVSDN